MIKNKTWFVLTSLLGGAIFCVAPAGAQVQVLPGLFADRVAAPGSAALLPDGVLLERHVRLQSTKGPFEVYNLELTLEPGAEIPWHTNPGVSVFTMTEGALTEYHSNGCISLHEAGEVFVETDRGVHRIVNDGLVPAVGLAVFLVPTGSPLLIPATEPAPRACAPGLEHE